MSNASTVVNESTPLWEGYAAHEVRLPWCTKCNEPFMPPSPFCPFCLSEAIDWRKASGRGALTTWVIEHRKVVPEFDPPFAVGHIELEEGPRIVASLSMEDHLHFRSGAPGIVHFHEPVEGRVLPIFRLTK